MLENRVSATVEDAVKNRDIPKLRSSLATLIKLDPGFRSDNYEKKLKYIQKNDIDVFEPYQKLKGEFTKPEKEWSKEYFFYQVEWLLDNFSRERVDRLKKIGQAVFSTPQDTPQTSQPKQAEAFSGVPAGTAGHPKASPSPSRKKKSRLRLVLRIIAAAVTILLVVWLVKRMNHPPAQIPQETQETAQQ